ncbi:hypothetical protein [Albibacterium profundi]|uniref:Uncharacterized protein n=1 Tax=Albibacterium profundi TaxID=3134906 RepID=A0ABV5CFV6_9SPHI
MWIRISKINVRQVDASHLENPKNADNPMMLSLYQQESRMAFFVSTHKKILTEYLQVPGGTSIPKRKWSAEMNEFAEVELVKTPPKKGSFKLTVVGWLFFVFAFGLLGYLAYEGMQEPAKKEAYQQRMTEKAQVAEGDIYFGSYRMYKEEGNVLGSQGGFGWFKVVKIENDTYYIAKSNEISKNAKPKEQMNSTDFEEETSAVKAKELEAYTKQFVSEDGLLEFNLNEKR